MSWSGHNSEAPFVEESESLIRQHLFEPLPEPGLPTSGSQVLQWLFDFRDLKVPVTAIFYRQMLLLQGPPQHLAPQTDACSAVVTFTDLLQTASSLPFSSDMDTCVYMCHFVERVWSTLADFSPTCLQYSLLLSKASQLSSGSSQSAARKLRPDTMLVEQDCTLMLGEDRHTDLAAAFAELERKRVDLSGMQYGSLTFMLGYAAAGTAMQWCFLPCHKDQVRSSCVDMHQVLLTYAMQWCSLPCHKNQVGTNCWHAPRASDLRHKLWICHISSSTAGTEFKTLGMTFVTGDIASVPQPVQEMGPQLDFCCAKDRVSFLLSLIQAYRLLAVMSAAVPRLPGRRPLFHEIVTEHSMYVSLFCVHGATHDLVLVLASHPHSIHSDYLCCHNLVSALLKLSQHAKLHAV